MLVTEIMTPSPRVVRDTARIADAVDILQSMPIRHLPVVDEDGSLVGMLSDRDLGPMMRNSTNGAEAPLDLSSRTVADFMSGDVVSVDIEADVTEAVEKILEERVGAVPVIDGDGQVVGIVSYVDILRALAAREQ